MAITAIAARGTGIANGSSTLANITPNATLAVGRTAVLVCVTENGAATTTGATNRHQTCADNSGGSNVWTKVGEYTHSPTSTLHDGVTTSVWISNLTTQLTTGNTITVTQQTATVDKALSLYEFSSVSGLQLNGSPDYQIVVGANGFGSSPLSGFSSAERLWLRGMGKHANTTTALTVTGGFTAITNVRSRNNVAAMTVYGEFIIATATGETSNPTLAVSGDTASVFVALGELVTNTARPVVFVAT